MELISTHICKGKNVGVHGNLFGGTMLSWLDEAGGAYASQPVDSPRIVTVKLSEVAFKKTNTSWAYHKNLRQSEDDWDVFYHHLFRSS